MNAVPDHRGLIDGRIPVLLDRLASAPNDARAGLRRHIDVLARGCGRSFAEAEAEVQALRAPPSPRPAPVVIVPAVERAPAPVLVKPARPSRKAAAAALFVRIDAALLADPSLPDREIARRLGCSQFSVSKRRKAIGLGAVDRVVKRGSQTFTVEVRA